MSSNIGTLSALYTEITRLLDGEDPTISDLSVASLSRLLVVAQRRIYRDIRTRWNEKTLADVVVSGNAADIPSDLEGVSVMHLGRHVLQPVDESVIRDYWASGGGPEKFFAHAGNQFIFWPSIADGTHLQGRYYARLADLTDANMASNALFQVADDLFVYAALVESAPFFGARQDMPTWEAKYQSIVERLNKRDHRAAYSAGRLMMRPSARICGRSTKASFTGGAGSSGGSGGDDIDIV